MATCGRLVNLVVIISALLQSKLIVRIYIYIIFEQSHNKSFAYLVFFIFKFYILLDDYFMSYDHAISIKVY